MRFGALPSVALFVVMLAGCDSCDDKSKTTGTSPSASTSAMAPASASASASAMASASASATPDAGAPKHDMANCPTAVAGATVAIKDVEGGVEVTVTGKDDATTTTIRERTKKLAAADRGTPDGGGMGKHDHSGSGGGTTGRCTIIMRNTDITTADVDKGSKITVKAKDKAEVDWVRRETKDRDKEAKSAGAEGAGAQRMAHCPSAVEGAKTALKDTKDGVLVTVTGPADKVAEIRSRAKHAADVAKKADAAKIEHTGEGTGGGGLGRCPIVVEGDATVDVKEIEGGVEVDVKSKKDPAALQKEAKARAANFASAAGAPSAAPTASAKK